MDQVSQKIGEIKQQLESAAFLVAQPNEQQAAHKEILNALVSLSELDIACGGNNVSKLSDLSISDEVKKVNNRLKLWANRPHQKNSRILKAYLKLERQGMNPITLSALHKAVGKDAEFHKNFPQMKNIAEKNHGKVFEVNGEIVTLWPRVEPAIRQYEKSVLGDDRL